MIFCYYMTQRPPMPGAQPKKGLIDIQTLDANQPTKDVGRAYARLTYDRPLSSAEISGYELMPDTDQLRQNEDHYMGMLIKFNPILNGWDVWDNNVFVTCAETLEEAKEGIRSL